MPDSKDYFAKQFNSLMRRYGGSTPEAFVAVMCPILVPIETLDKSIVKMPGQGHYRASFTAKVTDETRQVLQRGRTGKFVPSSFAAGGGWREIAKGRFIEVDSSTGLAAGEIYVGGTKGKLEKALESLSHNDFLEIDQFGAAAKVLSGLAEYYIADTAQQAGYTVRRMPEDMAQHLGGYANYDFQFEKNGVIKKVEAKSIWGTNTDFARLIHSTTTKPDGEPSTWTADQKRNYYPTSSCKFSTQDIFAVSLFLRTGNICDIAFARSVSNAEKPHGLPPCSGHPDHVNQNPSCEIGDGTWFASVDEVWDLE